MVIKGKVYYGGGKVGRVSRNAVGSKFTIYCYNPTTNKWCPHAILPVKFYGLGQLNQKIIAVGGCKVPTYVNIHNIIDITSEVYEIPIDSAGPTIEIKKPWTHSRMKKGRYLPTILSSDSSLIVIGGHGENSSDLSDMEIFDTLSKQWSLVESNLPFGVCNFSATPVGDKYYLLGMSEAEYEDRETKSGKFHNGALSIQLPATPSSVCDPNHPDYCWQALTSTPLYSPIAASVYGHPLAIGGKSPNIFNKDKNKDLKEVKSTHVYAWSERMWIRMNSDLPTHISSATTVTISEYEFLIIGGKNLDNEQMATVYKGSLNFF